jgi:hypothetical protein
MTEGLSLLWIKSEARQKKIEERNNNEKMKGVRSEKSSHNGRRFDVKNLLSYAECGVLCKG